MPRRLSVSVLLAVVLVASLQFGGSANAATFSLTKIGGSGSIFEPGIDIGPDGTIFVNGPTGVGNHTLMWRSTDNGATYKGVTVQTPWNRMPGGGDGDIVVGPEKQVYMMDLWLGSNSIIRSEDNGVTWSGGAPISSMPPSDRQWIALGPKDETTGMDTVYVIYQLFPVGVWFAKSVTGGQAWTTHKGVPGGIGQGDQAGQVVADGNRVATAFHTLGRIIVSTSTNRGDTWETNEPTIWTPNGAFGGDMSPLALEGNTLVTAWTDAQDNSLWVARSEDFGQTWNQPVHIETGGNTNAYPWLDMRNGKVAVVWYGGTTPGDPDTVPNSNVWNVMYSESLDGGATFSAPTIAVPDVKRDQICLNGLNCTQDRELGDFFQVAIHPLTGKSYISTVDITPSVATWVARQN